MKTLIIKSLVIFFFLSSMFSCHKKSYLEQALELAGDNRAELEKVLELYSTNPADSLKLKAARFLIENMPWHFSYGGKYMESYMHRVDSCLPSLPVNLRNVIYALPGENPSLFHRLEIKPDIQTMTADYLIYNIEKSFEIWKESSWLNELHFENFCEYLLPYRLGREPLTYWKDSLPDKFREQIIHGSKNLLRASADPYALYDFLNKQLMKGVDYYTSEYPIPEVEIGNYTFDCMNSSTAYTFLWRMCGIPTATDIFPRHGRGNNAGHSTITIIDERMLGGVSIEPYHAVAKVYRNTFSVNHSQILRQSKNFVPPVARNPFFRDVTASYVRTSDITIPLKVDKNRAEHMYLGIFSLGWEAIAHAPVKRGKSTFKNMGVGVAYIPFYYIGNQQIFVSDPFYLDAKKQIHYFHADKKNTRTVKLERKFPTADWKTMWSEPFVNSRIEASNDKEFTRRDTIFTTSEYTYWRMVSASVDDSIKARYYRLIRNNDLTAYLAEFHFYDTKGEKVKGKWIGDSLTMKASDLSKIHDGNILTFDTLRNWIGVNFGKEVPLSKIEYLPRNDANGIYPGMKYELLYFDKDKWASISVKTATDYSITFDDVPENALLWLRNLTEGKEERIFVYRDGKQWWL